MKSIPIGRRRRVHAKMKGGPGGPGRPKGMENGEGKTPSLADPKPIHDYMLLLHMAGRTNVEVAETLGVTPTRVSQVLRSDWAKKRIEHLQQNVQQNLMGSIDAQLTSLAHRSLENIRKTVEAPISVLHPMKKHQDKIGMELLQGVGFLRGADRDDNGKLTFGEDAAARLSKAIERANNIRAKRENEVEVQEAVVVKEETPEASSDWSTIPLHRDGTG